MSVLPEWWRWEDVPGARYVASRASPLDSVSGRVPDDPPRGWRPYPGAMPCESDPATIGCLTARVREMCGDPRLYARPAADGTGWMIYSLVHGWAFYRPTEWSALMAAGDAAWARRGGAS